MLDNGSGAIAVYAIFDNSGTPARLLVINTNYYDGTGTRTSSTVTFTDLGDGSVAVKRMTAPSATARVDEGAVVTIGGSPSFTSTCVRNGTQITESMNISGGSLSVLVHASEALIVFLSLSS
jgi:hypothetical protein